MPEGADAVKEYRVHVSPYLSFVVLQMRMGFATASTVSCNDFYSCLVPGSFSIKCP